MPIGTVVLGLRLILTGDIDPVPDDEELVVDDVLAGFAGLDIDIKPRPLLSWVFWPFHSIMTEYEGLIVYPCTSGR
jgi:hypothetical protein